jgi:hypothetical protein
VLSVEDWAEIRRLHWAERMSIKQIARVLGVAKRTVRRALAADGLPRYRWVAWGSIVDGVEPRIRGLLAAWPRMPATVIAERIGWTRGLRVLKQRVRGLRPVCLPPDLASWTAVRLGRWPGATGGSWRSPCRWVRSDPLGGQAAGAGGVSGCARWLAARLIPCGAWGAWSAAGGSCSPSWGRGRGCWCGTGRRGRPVSPAADGPGRGHPRLPWVLGAKVVSCDPADPEAKGLVERATGYLETSFLPGRSFAWPAASPPSSRRVAGGGQPAAAPRAGLRTGRPDRGGSGGDAAAAAGRASDRLAQLVAAAARSLRAGGRQRLLGPLGGSRPPRGGHRRPGAGAGVV